MKPIKIHNLEGKKLVRYSTMKRRIALLEEEIKDYLYLESKPFLELWFNDIMNKYFPKD